MDTFENIYEEYFPRVYSFLFRICNNENLAEELTQETFFRAFRSFHEFRGDSELFTWLASIAKYTLYSYLKKNRRESDCINYKLLSDAITDNIEDDPADVIQKDAINDAVRRVINKIPEKYRDVVMLRIYAELPFSEIAENLKISENSAKVLFFRAKKMLQKELDNEHLL